MKERGQEEERERNWEQGVRKKGKRKNRGNKGKKKRGRGKREKTWMYPEKCQGDVT